MASASGIQLAPPAHVASMVPCCSGRSGEGNDHDDAIAIGMFVVGALVLAVLGYGLLKLLSWRSERRPRGGHDPA